jgi:DUF4097 and DUF4098 domain-containing protein YvlB
MIPAALLVVLSFAFSGHAADEVFDRTIPLAPTGSFAIRNVNGPVTVEGWDRDAVEVHAVKTADHGSAVLSEARIDVAASADAVSVTTVYPRNGTAEIAVAYTVRVPRRALLQQVATVNGAVRVDGVAGPGELRSVNGNIDVSDSAGGLSAHTTNGNIHMAFAKLNAPGPLTMETINGSIVLAVPKDASASLEAASLNGDFRSELPLVVTAAYGAIAHGPRQIRGQLGDGSTALYLHTVNGAIRVVALTKVI